MMKCDPVTGTCLLPDPEEPDRGVVRAMRDGLAVHYIGDPMCSWCWGISPTVNAVAAFCEAEGIAFSLTMGGLRAGGGDPWNLAFKTFLRNEWSHIAQVTGQPFGFTLLEADRFDYDTEPACRAVVTVQFLQAQSHLEGSTALRFFSAVQRKFYVDGKDPTLTEFYASICADMDLNFDEFRTLFESEGARKAVTQAFVRCRQWGLRAFPTLLLERNAGTETLASGYVTTEQILSRLRQEIASAAISGQAPTTRPA